MSRRAATFLCFALMAIAVLSGCEPEQPGPAVPVVSPHGIEIEGGIRVTREEIAAFDDYFGALDPHVGVKQRTRVLLERHLLPLALSRVGFPQQRELALQRAHELCAVAGNALEFQRATAVSEAERIESRQRTQLPLPVAAWARDETLIGAVSPPLETAEEIWVASLLELQRGLTIGDDHLTLRVVRFPAHDAPKFTDWMAQRESELRGKLIHCDKDLVDALPGWLHP